MIFIEIIELFNKGVFKLFLKEVLKFDCGNDGVIIFGFNGVGIDLIDVECIIKIIIENLGKLFKGKLNLMIGVMMGKLKVFGNLVVVM